MFAGISVGVFTMCGASPSTTCAGNGTGFAKPPSHHNSIDESQHKTAGWVVPGGFVLKRLQVEQTQKIPGGRMNHPTPWLYLKEATKVPCESSFSITSVGWLPADNG